MRYTPLLESNTPGICEELAIKEKIIISITKILTLRDVPGNLTWYSHTSHRG